MNVVMGIECGHMQFLKWSHISNGVLRLDIGTNQ